MRRLVIVLHDYTTDEARREAERLRSLVESVVGFSVIACTLRELEESQCVIEESDIVYPLLILRGSGYSLVENKARNVGARMIPPLPLEYVSEQLARSLTGCGSILLLHAEAGRSRVLSELSSEVSRRLGVPVGLSRECIGDYDCVAVLSILPGVTTAKAIESCKGKVIVPYLLSSIRDIIIEWLKSNSISLGYL